MSGPEMSGDGPDVVHVVHRADGTPVSVNGAPVYLVQDGQGEVHAALGTMRSGSVFCGRQLVDEATLTDRGVTCVGCKAHPVVGGIPAPDVELVRSLVPTCDCEGCEGCLVRTVSAVSTHAVAYWRCRRAVLSAGTVCGHCLRTHLAAVLPIVGRQEPARDRRRRRRPF